jgi:hypothetical protein
MRPPVAPPRPRAASIDDLASFEIPEQLALPKRRGRMLELLAASFLLLNTALILFAWRAGDDFEQTLAAITRTITSAVERGSGTPPRTTPGAGDDPDPGVTPRIGQQPDESGGDRKPAPGQRPSAIESFHQLALRIGQQHMAEGEYAQGRRSLYHMLANHDRAVVTPELVAEAEFLIAHSYKLEAESLVEAAQ